MRSSVRSGCGRREEEEDEEEEVDEGTGGICVPSTNTEWREGREERQKRKKKEVSDE